MTHPSSAIESAPPRAMVTVEALLAMIPLMIIIVLAISAWRVRVVEQHTGHQAHDNMFADLTSGISSLLPNIRLGMGIGPEDMQLQSSFAQQYPIDQFPNNARFGSASNPFQSDIGALMHIGPQTVHREAAAIRPPWIYPSGAASLDGIQNLQEAPPIRQWFSDIIDGEFQEVDDEFHIDRSDL